MTVAIKRGRVGRPLGDASRIALGLALECRRVTRLEVASALVRDGWPASRVDRVATQGLADLRRRGHLAQVDSIARPGTRPLPVFAPALEALPGAARAGFALLESISRQWVVKVAA